MGEARSRYLHLPTLIFIIIIIAYTLAIAAAAGFSPRGRVPRSSADPPPPAFRTYLPTPPPLSLCILKYRERYGCGVRVRKRSFFKMRYTYYTTGKGGTWKR